jgi:hypothetical protein
MRNLILFLALVVSTGCTHYGNRDAAYSAGGIVITSSWGGLVKSAYNQVEIVETSDGYYMYDEMVDTQKVTDLLDAIQAPPHALPATGTSSCFEWFDDYPDVSIVWIQVDGTTVEASTECQAPLMLPWKVRRNGRTAITWNADISRSLAALLPYGFTNKRRLAGYKY